MGKVKSELLTEYPCANADCDVLFDARRAELGYCTLYAMRRATG
jgi:hypothetical protein